MAEGGVGTIMRETIKTFFHNYHSFASIAMIAVFPASASLLFSQALTVPPSSSSLIGTVQSRFRSLFVAAGFPVYSDDFFSLVGLKLSQTIFSFFFTLPFTLTFLIVSKASIITIACQLQDHHRRRSSAFSLRLYRSLLQTHLCNSFAILSTNAAAFYLLFLVFNFVDAIPLISSPSANIALVLSASGAIIYSIVLAHVLVVCNLAVIISGVENRGGYLSILKSFLLIRTRTSTALFLALPVNLGMAAVEALFQYRVMRPYQKSNVISSSLICEAISIAYIHSHLVVIDIIASCIFFKSLKVRRNMSTWDIGSITEADRLKHEEEPIAKKIYELDQEEEESKDFNDVLLV